MPPAAYNYTPNYSQFKTGSKTPQQNKNISPLIARNLNMAGMTPRTKLLLSSEQTPQVGKRTIGMGCQTPTLGQSKAIPLFPPTSVIHAISLNGSGGAKNGLIKEMLKSGNNNNI